MIMAYRSSYYMYYTCTTCSSNVMPLVCGVLYVHNHGLFGEQGCGFHGNHSLVTFPLKQSLLSDPFFPIYISLPLCMVTNSPCVSFTHCVFLAYISTILRVIFVGLSVINYTHEGLCHTQNSESSTTGKC